MKNKNKSFVVVPALMFGIGLAIPTFAQDASTSAPVPASTSMHQAGENTESAAKNAYVGTATAVEDTKITAKLKTAFASGKDINSNDIHVTTIAGMVTLAGKVQNTDTSARVEAIAKNTEGVRGVTNNLQAPSVSSQN